MIERVADPLVVVLVEEGNGSEDGIGGSAVPRNLNGHHIVRSYREVIGQLRLKQQGWPRVRCRGRLNNRGSDGRVVAVCQSLHQESLDVEFLERIAFPLRLD